MKKTLATAALVCLGACSSYTEIARFDRLEPGALPIEEMASRSESPRCEVTGCSFLGLQGSAEQNTYRLVLKQYTDVDSWRGVSIIRTLGPLYECYTFKGWPENATVQCKD